MTAFLDPIPYCIEEPRPQSDQNTNILDNYLDLLEEYYYYLFLYSFLLFTFD